MDDIMSRRAPTYRNLQLKGKTLRENNNKGRLPSRFFVSTHAIAYSVVVTLMEFFSPLFRKGGHKNLKVGSYRTRRHERC